MFWKTKPKGRCDRDKGQTLFITHLKYVMKETCKKTLQICALLGDSPLRAAQRPHCPQLDKGWEIPFCGQEAVLASLVASRLSRDAAGSLLLPGWPLGPCGVVNLLTSPWLPNAGKCYAACLQSQRNREVTSPCLAGKYKVHQTVRKTRLQAKAWVLLLHSRAVVPPPLPSPGRAATPPQPPRRRGSLNEYTGFVFHTFFPNRLFSLTRLDEKNILSKRRLVGFSDFLITTSTL